MKTISFLAALAAGTASQVGAYAPETSPRPEARPDRAYEMCMSEGGDIFVVPLPDADPTLALSQCKAALDGERFQ